MLLTVNYLLSTWVYGIFDTSWRVDSSPPTLTTNPSRSACLKLQNRGQAASNATSPTSPSSRQTSDMYKGRTTRLPTHCRELPSPMCNWESTMVPWLQPNNRTPRYKPIALPPQVCNWRTFLSERKAPHSCAIRLLAMLDQLYLPVGNAEFST